MNSSISNLDPSELLDLWQGHPCYKEYEKIQEGIQEFQKTLDRKSENYKKYSVWTPIVKKENRDFSKLQNKFHPAIVQDQRLYRINESSMDIFKTSIYLIPKIENELSTPTFIDRFITFHADGPFFFKPSIFEVLNEMPEEIIEAEGNFFFTVETISDDRNVCAIGSWRQYIVGVTTIYRV